MAQTDNFENTLRFFAALPGPRDEYFLLGPSIAAAELLGRQAPPAARRKWFEDVVCC